MKNTKRTFWFTLTLLIPVVILLTLPIKPLMTTLFGEQIAVRTLPVDPRDLFYGDYVQVNLAITEVPANLLDQQLLDQLKEPKNYRDTPVYVALQPVGEVYEVSHVSLSKPKEDIYLKGSLNPYSFKWGNQGWTAQEVYRVDYQLDRFYLEEGSGLELEKLAREGQLLAYMKVRNGYAVLGEIK